MNMRRRIFSGLVVGLLFASVLGASPATAQGKEDSNQFDVLESALLEVAELVRGGPADIDLDPLITVVEPGTVVIGPKERERSESSTPSHRVDMQDEKGEFDGSVHRLDGDGEFGDPGRYLLTVFDTSDGSARTMYIANVTKRGYKLGEMVTERERPGETVTLGGGQTSARAVTVGLCKMHTYNPILAGGVTVLGQGKIDSCTQSATVFVDTRLHVWSSAQSMWSIIDVEWGSGENFAVADATGACVSISQTRVWRTRVAGTAIFHPSGFATATGYRFRSLPCI